MRFYCRIEQLQRRIDRLRLKDWPRWHGMEFRQRTDVVRMLLRGNSVECRLEQAKAMSQPSQSVAVVREERMAPR